MDDFMELVVGRTYRLRMVGKPYEYYQHWKPIVCRSPGVRDGEVLDPLMVMGKLPTPMYAAWFLVRAGDVLKLVDFPESLLNHLLKWAKANNAEPGGRHGCDWEIRCVRATHYLNKSKYDAVALGQTPFTEAEFAVFGARGDLASILEKARSPHTTEEIRHMLDEERGRQVAAPSTAVAAPKGRRRREKLPAKDDDMFQST